MGHKSNPIGLRVAIQRNWETISYYNKIEEDNFLRDIIKKLWIKEEILISKIKIHKTDTYYKIKFIYYTIEEKTKYKINYLVSFTKRIIEKYLNKHVYVEIVEIPTYVINEEILAEWIKRKMKEKGENERKIMKTVFKEYKKWYNY